MVLSSFSPHTCQPDFVRRRAVAVRSIRDSTACVSRGPFNQHRWRNSCDRKEATPVTVVCRAEGSGSGSGSGSFNPFRDPKKEVDTSSCLLLKYENSAVSVPSLLSAVADYLSSPALPPPSLSHVG